MHLKMIKMVNFIYILPHTHTHTNPRGGDGIHNVTLLSDFFLGNILENGYFSLKIFGM